MIKPTIHRNGTSREALLDQHRDLANALRAALDKMGDAWPNGRDYYPQGDDALRTALTEWSARRAKLGEVLSEIEAITEHICDAD